MNKSVYVLYLFFITKYLTDKYIKIKLLPALAGSEDKRVTPLFIKSKPVALDLGIKNLKIKSIDSRIFNF